jgi:signal transduction histidine kinase
MLKKLSFRFSAAAIGTLFFIELVMILFINGFNFRETLRQTDDTLALLVENGGKLPDIRAMPPFGMRGEFQPDNRADREWRYTMRYFSARTDGFITVYNTLNIATVELDTVEEYAEDVFSREDFKGFYNGMNFRCQVKTFSDGSRLAVFCDFSTAAQSFGRVAKLSAGISLGLLAVFSVIIVLLSKRVVKPVIENQEKQARFITDAGHELKTPLAIIRANTEVIEMTAGESEWTRSTINQTDRLNDLLQRMLMLAKSSESSSFSFAELDLTALARKLADDFETYCNAENKPLEANIAEGVIVNGDAKMLDMLLSTLLENAVKYGKPENPIGLSLAESGKYLTLEVTNLCSDPPQGDTRLLFDRFYRGDSSRTRETGGSGIGLSIAKMITEAHKGKIACNVEGERVTFTVRLPKETHVKAGFIAK